MSPAKVVEMVSNRVIAAHLARTVYALTRNNDALLLLTDAQVKKMKALDDLILAAFKKADK